MNLTKYYYLYDKGKNLKLVNTLTGKILSVDEKIKDAILNLQKNTNHRLDKSTYNFLCKNQFLLEDKVEKSLIDKAYCNYKNYMDSLAMTNFFFITYDCNLRCKYCCYRYLSRNTPVMNETYINNAFEVIEKLQDQKKRKVTRFVLSGGEPLLLESKKSVTYYFERLKKFSKFEQKNNRKCISTIFTNGVNIPKYKKFIKQQKQWIDLVFITLNGTKKIHDSERVAKNGQGSFDDVVKGINTLLDLGVDVLLVANISKKTVDSLPDFLNVVNRQGWNNNKNYKGYYISRIKDHRRDDRDSIDEHEILKKVIAMIKDKKIRIEDFNFGDLRILKSIMNFIKNANKSTSYPFHQFSGCNNRASQYSFAVDGYIYSCAPSMGNAKYATGQFYPEIDYATIDDKAWLNRTILDNQDCLNCSVAFLCGGGCVYQALEKSNDPNKIICTKADLVLETFMTAIDQNISLVHEDTLYE